MTTNTNTVTFNRLAAQGDLLIIRMGDGEEFPEGVKEVPLENGNMVLAHSETGHHHAILGVESGAKHFADPADSMTCYLTLTEPKDLVHLRSFDTHQTISFKPGKYKLRRQREATPEGWKRVED